MKKRSIGIYDSGIGGLTVLQALRTALPHENFVYFADTLNLPYGDKTKDEIVHYSHNIISWLTTEKDVKLVIAACHTSSALALDHIGDNFDVPILGTIYPLVQCLLANPEHKRIGIIATVASAKSQTHAKIFKDQGFSGEIMSIGCPDFVPLIESHPLDTVSLTACAQDYLSAFEKHQLDTLIYGCTHYPFIKNMIEDILPPTMTYIDPATHIADEAREQLQQQSLLNDSPSEGDVVFYCSHDPHVLAPKIQSLLGIATPHVICDNIHSDVDDMRIAANQ